MQNLKAECERAAKTIESLRVYESKAEKLREDAERLQQEKIQSENEIAELKKKHIVLQDHISSLKNEEIRQESQLAALQEELSGHGTAANAKEAENRTLRDKVHALQSEIVSLNAIRDQTAKDLKEAREASHALETSLQHLKNEKQQLEDRFKQLEEQVLALNSSSEELRQTVKSKEEERQKLEQQLRHADDVTVRIHGLERDKACLLDKSASLWFDEIRSCVGQIGRDNGKAYARCLRPDAAISACHSTGHADASAVKDRKVDARRCIEIYFSDLSVCTSVCRFLTARTAKDRGRKNTP